MTAPLMLFQFVLEGVQCSEAEVTQWLLADIPELRSHPPLLIYKEVMLRVVPYSKTLPSFYATAWGDKFGYWQDHNYRLLNHIVAQEVFCVLERRGFRVSYQGGELNWERQP